MMSMPHYLTKGLADACYCSGCPLTIGKWTITIPENDKIATCSNQQRALKVFFAEEANSKDQHITVNNIVLQKL